MREVVLSAGEESDGPVVLSLIGVFVRQMASVVSVASESAMVSAELAYVFCQVEGQTLAHFWRDFKHTGGSCCKEKIELLHSVLVRGRKPELDDLRVQLLEKQL